MSVSAADFDWMEEAECTKHDPETFFPSQTGPVPKHVRAICLACPVQAECLARVLAAEGSAPPSMRFGVYAATTPWERYRMDRNSRRRWQRR